MSQPDEFMSNQINHFKLIHEQNYLPLS